MESKKIKSLIVFFVTSILLVAVFQAAVSFFLPTEIQQKWGIQKKQTASVVTAFENITLEARAAYVFDLQKQELIFAFHENDPLPLASVTKLMTAFVAREKASESALLVLSSDDLSADGDSGLRVGERWRLGDLLDTMLLISSNDAAHAVARFIGADKQAVFTEGEQDSARARFVEMMNTKAHELGLSSMEFFNESGLDIDGANPQNGGYGSAHDVATLLADLWEKYPATVEVTALPAARIISQDNIVHVLPNTDEAVGKFSGLIASKTGYTTLAGGNLAIIFDRGINDPVVAVVLGSSQKGRFDDMARLVVAASKI